jgi:hypothetical protein
MAESAAKDVDVETWQERVKGGTPRKVAQLAAGSVSP